MANTMLRSTVNGPSALGARLIAGVLALLALTAGACAGDDETPPGLYSEPCDMSTTCATGLTCYTAIGICSQGCATMQECRTRLGESATLCVGGVCQEPCSATAFDPCRNGLMCIQSQAGATCRAK
jgi:hypothetical protein